MAYKHPPSELYKYRAFDALAIKPLIDSQFWYSPMAAFNDPIEGQPALINDVDPETVERLHRRFYGSDSESRHLYGYDAEENVVPLTPAERINCLVSDLEQQLAKMLSAHGVLSLSARWDSSLMWSHYGDSHRGICLGFTTEGHLCHYLGPIDYDSPRGVLLSHMQGWLENKDNRCRARVVEAAFQRKAADWSYEEEWRDVVTQSGSHSATMQIASITFGMRCPAHVRVAVLKLFSGEQTMPLFYRAHFKQQSYEIGRWPVNPEEEAYLRPPSSFAFGLQRRRKSPL